MKSNVTGRKRPVKAIHDKDGATSLLKDFLKRDPKRRKLDSTEINTQNSIKTQDTENSVTPQSKNVDELLESNTSQVILDKMSVTKKVKGVNTNLAGILSPSTLKQI